jgi:hypothetical protein
MQFNKPTPCAMSFDDLSALPEPLRNANYISSAILSPLIKLRGVVLSGIANPTYVSAKKTTYVQMGDFNFQMRIYPKGLISKGQLADLSSVRSPILVQSLMSKENSMGHCSLALLVPPSLTGSTISVFDSFHPAGVSTGAKNVHIIPCSLFDCHSIINGTEYSISDNHNFQSCVSCIFHTSRPTASGHGSLPFSVGGVSSFYMALSLARSSVPDEIFRPYQEIPWSRWQSLTTALSEKLQASSNTAVQDMFSAVGVTDLLSIEGLIAILSNSFLAGILPDAIHLPDSIPLYIAMALRLAMRSEWYSLPVPSKSDAHAVSEIRCGFETTFKPILIDHQGPKYAIDMAIQRALEDAARASLSHGTQAAHVDSLKLWGAAGMHAIVQLFGLSFDDVLPSTAAFGESTLCSCPILKAGRSYISSTTSPNEVSSGHNQLLTRLSPLARRKATCMQILNSVEVWIRKGSYQIWRISAENNEAPFDDEDNALAQLVKGDGEQVQQFLSGMVAAAAEHKAGETAAEHKTSVERLVQDVTDEMKALTVSVKIGFETSINLVAFQDSSNRMAAALCQGTLAIQQMPIASWLAHEEAVVTCASCNARVPLLVATMVSLPQSGCSLCHRPRCLSCQKKQTTRCKCKKTRKKGN